MDVTVTSQKCNTMTSHKGCNYNTVWMGMTSITMTHLTV